MVIHGLGMRWMEGDAGWNSCWRLYLHMRKQGVKDVNKYISGVKMDPLTAVGHVVDTTGIARVDDKRRRKGSSIRGGTVSATCMGRI